MTFSLTMSSSDLLLLLPEILLTSWLCLILIIDFSFPRLPKENWRTSASPVSLPPSAASAWFDIAGIIGSAVREHVRRRPDGVVLQNVYRGGPRFWSSWHRSITFIGLRFSAVNIISSS